MKVAVIIPSHNLADKLGRCLDHVNRTRTAHEVKVTVVDNNIDQTTWAVAETRLDMNRDTYVRLPEQLTFACACNLGAALNRSAAILVFLNNDCYVEENWLDPLIEAYTSGHGVIGARLLYANGMVQHAGGWIGPGWRLYHRYYCAECVAIHEESQTPGRKTYDYQNSVRLLRIWARCDVNRFLPADDFEPS